MTREEILAVAKPILFNTEMVRAVKDNRKTVTRRVVKPQPACNAEIVPSPSPWYGWENDTDMWHIKPPYRPGDILYVRETWAPWSRTEGTMPEIHYKADEETPQGVKWHPSIHMPKKAARIFLRVTDVRVERLKDMTAASAMDEGFTDWNDVVRGWNSTLKPADRSVYGWDANPWVWVIEFEKMEADK